MVKIYANYENTKMRGGELPISSVSGPQSLSEREKLGTYVMKRVAAGAHLPTPWLFGPAKRPDDRAD